MCSVSASSIEDRLEKLIKAKICSGRDNRKFYKENYFSGFPSTANVLKRRLFYKTKYGYSKRIICICYQQKNFLINAYANICK